MSKVSLVKSVFCLFVNELLVRSHLSSCVVRFLQMSEGKA